MSFDAIVVGSGFGGAVAACRLSQAGLKVRLLERGRRYRGAEFPRDLAAFGRWSWDGGGGLFDVKDLDGMIAVQSAAYGGGSQIYANVHLRPPASVFGSGWPRGLDRASLDPYYDLVAYMLDIAPITAGPRLPRKTVALKRAAAELGREADFFHPNLAVRFTPGPNKFGVPQSACTYCGRCDVGCDVGAKNTLDLNYLAVAEKLGLDVGLRSTVHRVQPASGGGYEVLYRDEHGAEKSDSAAAVFLCAGAVNTVEMLLRCRDQFGTLPRLSPKLGHGYSGNGDYLAFAVDTQAEMPPSEGPTITSALRYDGPSPNGRAWFLLQDGGLPQLRLAMVAAHLFSERYGLGREVDALASALFRGVEARTAVLLAMGLDDGQGRIELDGLGCVRARWNAEANLPLYTTEERLAADVVGKLGGKLVLNPAWRLFKVPVSVHSLGGCAMGATAADSVLSPEGEVHHYPGLFVLDGAAIPGATGVNPSSTIAAVAERNVERFIQRKLPTWTAPERRLATPIFDPMPASPSITFDTPPATPLVGLAFTEKMVGHFEHRPPRDPLDPRDYLAAERRGRDAGRGMAFELTITMSNLDARVEEVAHSGIARGELRVEGLTPKAGAAVTKGLFNLFVAPPEDERASRADRRMLYALPFTGRDGAPYLLDGFKVIRDDGCFDVWGRTTTLFTVVREGHARTGRPVATGVVRILPLDFARQLTTFRTVGTGRVSERAGAVAAFSRLFVGGLWDTFVAPRLPLRPLEVGMSTRTSSASDAVVLVPGFMGFGRVGDLYYFSERISAAIRGALEQRSDRPVAVVPCNTRPTDALEARQGHLLGELATLCRQVPTIERLHLVGHSSGAVDAQLLTCAAPIPAGTTWTTEQQAVREKVRSVTAIGAPMHGTSLADGARGLLELSNIFSGTGAFRLARLGVNLARLSLRSTTRELVEDAAEQWREAAAFVWAMIRRTDLVSDLAVDRMAALRARVGRPDGRVQLTSFVTLTPPPSEVALRRPPSSLWDRVTCPLPDPFFAELYEITAAQAAKRATHVVPSLERLQGAPLVIHGKSTPLPAITGTANDGIVPSALQLFDPGDAHEFGGLVIADHADVIGHYTRSGAPLDPRRVNAGLFHSGSGFDDDAFFALYGAVADRIAQVSKKVGWRVISAGVS